MTRRVVLPLSICLLAVSAYAAMPEPGTVAVATPTATRPADGVPLPPLTVQPYQQEVAGIVAGFLEQAHYERVVVDDELSSAWLDRYVEELDGARIVFLQSDLEEFEQYRHRLDDDIEARPLPRVDSAIAIYTRYRQRLLDRAADAKEIAGGPIDLTNAETVVLDREDAGLGWPVDDAEARELWRQRVEEEFVSSLITGRDTEDEVRDRLIKRYDRLSRNMAEMETPDVLELWLDALTQSVDPHSVWFKPASKDDFNVDITNSVEGIGAKLTSEDGYVVVDSVIPGGPAELSNRVRPKDRILEVAQGSEAPVDVFEMRLDKVVNLIRGPKGTEVRLTLQHADAAEPEIVVLERQRVVLELSAAEGRVETVDGHKLGYLGLSGFYTDNSDDPTGHTASNDLAARIAEIQAQGVEGMVLDLRGNGGGSLLEAIEVAGLFLPGGPVVQVRDRDGGTEAMHDEDPRMAWDGPLTVMVDATSASASEIVAGALQDYGRAVIVGDHATHGKGTVQQVIGLTGQLRGRHAPDDDRGGAMKLTVQKFYRVSGGSTQKLGVLSDVRLPSVWDGIEFVHEADLPNALEWDRIPPAPYTRVADPAKVVATLQAKSKARIDASEDYERLERQLEVREKDMARTEISLVLSERQAEYDARKALSDAEDEDEEALAKLTLAEKKARARARDYELDEGLRILADLVELGG